MFLTGFPEIWIWFQVVYLGCDSGQPEWRVGTVRQGWGKARVWSTKEVIAATAAAKSLQSCPTLCHPIPGILQARTLEWAAISFSNA